MRSGRKSFQHDVNAVSSDSRTFTEVYSSVVKYYRAGHTKAEIASNNRPTPGLKHQ